MTVIEPVDGHSRNSIKFKSAIVSNAIEKLELNEWKKETLMTPEEAKTFKPQIVFPNESTNLLK